MKTRPVFTIAAFVGFACLALSLVLAPKFSRFSAMDDAAAAFKLASDSRSDPAAETRAQAMLLVAKQKYDEERMAYRRRVTVLEWSTFGFSVA